MSKSQAKPAQVRDVARRAGVSVATVSRVLNGKDPSRFSAETAERVLAAAREMNFTPSELGRQLRTAKASAVALLVPDAANGFCADVASTLEPALQAIRLSMLLCNTSEDPERQDQYLRQMVNRGISANILLGAVESRYLRELSDSGRPLVFINRRPPAPIAGHFVGIDNRAAGRAVAEHFIARGFDRCAMIHGPQRYAASSERLTGFRERLAEAGIGLPQECQVESALTPEAGYARAKELLTRHMRPRAIFCGNDSIAYGVYRAARDAGLRVPEDIALFGFDDNRMNQWLAPWLSTVRVPVQDFGPVIADILQEHNESADIAPKTVLLPFELILRNSA